MLYIDTSFITPLIKQEPTSERVTRFVAGLPAGELTISHWTQVEFSSMLAREVRMGGMDAKAAVNANTQFDAIIAESFTVLLPGPDAFDLARQYIARFESGLRAGDALHLAIARTHRVTAIYSLDRTLIKAGTLFGLPVSDGAIGQVALGKAIGYIAPSSFAKVTEDRPHAIVMREHCWLLRGDPEFIEKPMFMAPFIVRLDP